MTPPAADLSPASPGSGRWPYVILAVLTLLGFGIAVRGDFVDWDDGLMVVHNPMLVPGSGQTIALAWQGPYAGLYAPLTYTLYAVIAAVGRLIGRPLDPALFHAASVGLHLLGGFVLFTWLRRLTNRPEAALLGTVFWLLHPLQAEPVAWVAGMNSVLSGLLAILALKWASYGPPKGIPANTATAGGTNRFWFALSCLAFAASLAAKPAAIALPAALMLVDRLLLRRPWKATLVRAAMWAIVALPFVYFGLSAQTTGLLEGDLPLARRAMIVGHAFGFYVMKTLWPIGLAADYGLPPTVVLTERLWPVPAVVAGMALLLAIVTLRRRPAVSAGIGISVVCLLPVLGIVPFYYQSFSIVADRYAYAALIGPALLIACLARNWPAKATVAPLLVLIVVLGGLTVRQVLVWQDTERLWRQAGRVNPEGLFYNYHVITHARDMGDADMELGALERVLVRRPLDGIQRLRYATVLLQAGRTEQAMVQLQALARREPRNPQIQILLGRAYLSERRPDDARRAFRAALAVAPDHPDALAGLRQSDAPPATAPVATQPARR